MLVRETQPAIKALFGWEIPVLMKRSMHSARRRLLWELSTAGFSPSASVKAIPGHTESSFPPWGHRGCSWGCSQPCQAPPAPTSRNFGALCRRHAVFAGGAGGGKVLVLPPSLPAPAGFCLWWFCFGGEKAAQSSL